MSRAALLADVNRFVGKQLIDCEAEIKAIAKLHRYSVLVYDPEFNTRSIVRDETRLNVRTDKDFKIVSFSTG
jgi:hypothetical protein